MIKLLISVRQDQHVALAKYQNWECIEIQLMQINTVTSRQLHDEAQQNF
jgi:hypothetical protein